MDQEDEVPIIVCLNDDFTEREETSNQLNSAKWKKIIIVMMIIACIMLVIIPFIVFCTNENRNVSFTKQTEKTRFFLEDSKNEITIPPASTYFIIESMFTTKNDTYVYIYGTFNNGQISYESKTLCRRSCSIKIRIEEQLVSGENMTVIAGPIDVINSFGGFIDFPRTERTPKPQDLTKKIKFMNSMSSGIDENGIVSFTKHTEKTRFFLKNSKNEITIPAASTYFIIESKFTTKNDTYVYIYGTFNNGQISYESKTLCRRSCSIKIRIEEQLVSGENMTVIAGPIDVINSFGGFIDFPRTERTPKPQDLTKKIKFRNSMTSGIDENGIVTFTKHTEKTRFFLKNSKNEITIPAASTYFY